MIDVAIKLVQVIILTLSSFAAVLTILLLLTPRFFERISFSMNKIINPDKVENLLEKQINAEKKLIPHIRLYSFFAAIFSISSLLILLHHKKFYSTKDLININTYLGWVIVFIVEGTQLFFYLSLSAIAIFSLLVIIFPSLLHKASIYCNKWIATERIYRELDFFKNFDEKLLKHRISIGIISLAILIYVIYACFLKFYVFK